MAMFFVIARNSSFGRTPFEAASETGRPVAEFGRTSQRSTNDVMTTGRATILNEALDIRKNRDAAEDGRGNPDLARASSKVARQCRVRCAAT